MNWKELWKHLTLQYYDENLIFKDSHNKGEKNEKNN